MGLPKKAPARSHSPARVRHVRSLPRQHGPYWYAYWKDYRGVTRKRYIGKQLPDDTPPNANQPNPAYPLAQTAANPMTTLHLDKAHRDAPGCYYDGVVLPRFQSDIQTGRRRVFIMTTIQTQRPDAGLRGLLLSRLNRVHWPTFIPALTQDELSIYCLASSGFSGPRSPASI
jgi:hypothetical protein